MPSTKNADSPTQPQSDRPWIVVIAASAGGIQALNMLLAALPADLDAAVVIVPHRTPTRTSHPDRFDLASAGDLDAQC